MNYTVLPKEKWYLHIPYLQYLWHRLAVMAPGYRCNLVSLFTKKNRSSWLIDLITTIFYRSLAPPSEYNGTTKERVPTKFTMNLYTTQLRVWHKCQTNFSKYKEQYILRIAPLNVSKCKVLHCFTCPSTTTTALRFILLTLYIWVLIHF